MECDLGNITVHYETLGEGRPILMLHGRPQDHTLSMFEMERHFTKRAGWKRIYPDLPGMGKTRANDSIRSNDDVLEAVDRFVDAAIAGERFALAGTSYGGYVARGLVHRRVRQLAGVLLVIPVIAYPRAKRTRPPRTVVHPDAAISAQARVEGHEWIEDVAVAFTPGMLELARTVDAANSPDADRIREALDTGYSFDVDALPMPVIAPSLFITGRQDNICGYADAWRMLEQYPRATFAVLDRAGHLVRGEQAAICDALVDEWLDRVEEAWSSTEARSN